jgi:5-methyltetrahydropteroyltriglutamate--homocysteine methyltransferase
VKIDIKNMKAAMKASGAKEGFIPCISPTNVEDWIANEHYKTDKDYLFAIADAMHHEYKAIADAGLIVQVDDPRLTTYYITQPNLSLKQVKAWQMSRVEALNHALRGIPESQIRFHTCYSINMGPRVHDMELKDMVDVLMSIKAGAYSFEAANPRHDHEWKVWKDVKIPNNRVLIPGLVTHSSILVEHPELVADRILNFASVVGRENIIAGTDCGFATFAGQHEIHPSITWAKLNSLVEGAKIASKQLWGRKGR